MNSLPLLVFFVLLLNGCMLESTQKTPSPKPATQANILLRTGKILEAAELYQQLAAQAPGQRDHYLVLAAQTYLKSGNRGKAQKLLQQIHPDSLSAEQRGQFYLMQAQTRLSLGDAEQALVFLQRVTPQHLNITDKRSFYQARSFAYSLNGQLLKSASERIKLSHYLDDGQRLYDNNRVIFETLSLLSDKTLAQHRSPPDTLGGWMALTRIIKSKDHDPEIFPEKIKQWRHNYPVHPANSTFLLQYFAQRKASTFKPANVIAVFLPASGPYARAAKAVRAGFEAAWRHDTGTKPQVRFYDSQSSDLKHLYQQAKNEGAELIVGPLQKNNIRNLIDATELDIPVLALNHVPGLKKNNLYQFGLSPIDEAEQITSLARAEGHDKALILVPDSELGHRLHDYYLEFWQQKQGTVLESQFFNASQHDFSGPIKQLLNIDESEARYRHLRRLLPGIKFSPRTRRDANALFLAGSANTLRLLNPQLHFYRAKHIPAYTISKVYGNHPDPIKDIDLNGIRFCDIPWVLDNAETTPLSQRVLQQDGLQVSPVYLKLAALGIDAYQLNKHLPQLNTAPYQGATGKLTLTDDYRIKRQLICAQFIDGYAKPLPSSEDTRRANPVQPIHTQTEENPFHAP